MAGILNPDSRFMTGINKVVDMIWVSVLWCVFCLPVVWIFIVLSWIAAFGENPDQFVETYKAALALETVTESEVLSALIADTYFYLMIEMLIRAIFIGPSTAALYYTMVKVIRRERGYATRTFFHGFKVNFKTGAPTSLIFVIFAIIMVVDFRYIDVIHADNPTFSSVLNVALLVVSIFALLVLVWIFPLLSRFTVSIRPLFKNACLISIRHFIGSFILAGGIVLIFWFILNFAGSMTGILILFPFFLPAGIALAASFIIEPVLKRYTGTRAKAVTEASADGEEAPEGAKTVAAGEGDAPLGESNADDGETEEDSSTDEWYME